MSQIHCTVSDKKIDASAVLEFAKDYGHGAQTTFFGAVRARNAGRNVIAVAYDAFEPLAEQILREIADEAREKWGHDLKIYIAHRTGNLAVGEVSVAIGVSSKHRDEAYQASRYVIEQIKLRAPIWKKEIYDNGETEWLKGHALCQRTHGVGHESHSHA